MDSASRDASQMYNSHFVSDSALTMRLGTQDIIDKIENFLRGKLKVAVKDDDGNYSMAVTKCGEPKANDLGVQSLVAKLNSIFNSAVVQGNYTLEMYQSHISDLRREICDDLVLNCSKWGISESDLSGIIGLIMSCFKGFLSRLIDNKERESYTNTIRTTENTKAGSNEGAYTR
ncbi:hypothetical protein ES702_02768 [subsurface metagenome]